MDGYEQTFTEISLKYILTDTPKNPTELRDLIVENVASGILDVFLAHNVPLVYLRNVVDGSTHALEIGLQKAQALDSGIKRRAYGDIKESAQEMNLRVTVNDIFNKAKQFDVL